jgi:Holliday junction resolvase RusA-like endonuclease
VPCKEGEICGALKVASRVALPEAHFATANPLAITIFYFPREQMEGDLDNIVKPILDALEKHIYMNDR